MDSVSAFMRVITQLSYKNYQSCVLIPTISPAIARNLQQMFSLSCELTPSSLTLLGVTSSDIVSPTRCGYMDSYNFSPRLPPYPTPAPITANPGANTCPEPPTKKLPTTDSHDFRVLGIGPPVVFDCSIAFTIYCAEKNQTKHYQLACNLARFPKFAPWSREYLHSLWRNTSPRSCVYISGISEGHSQSVHNSNLTTMHWTAYILKSKHFPKKTPHHLFDEESFHQFINIEVVQARKKDLLASHEKNNARSQGLLWSLYRQGGGCGSQQLLPLRAWSRGKLRRAKANKGKYLQSFRLG
ncbi:hypothetical protein VP01_3342g1 [Puccinia sorghi]|uniref:Uncharacterized protein n=1 Tax=Puccinia sorghi TaxID=27349 RepID=A0A0L6UYZ4_9BASI|nr:hypothetical protein VP01_3342g1 [Puccinia sorghi]